MKNWILAFALTLAFSMFAMAQGSSSSSASGSQATTSKKSSTTSSEKTATSTGKEKSVTGCLEQGSSAGTYTIKNAKHPNGVNVSYSGSEDLSKHVGHKVKATGSMSGDTLNATDVKHISEHCAVGGAGEASTGSTGHKHHAGGMSSGSSSGASTGGTTGGTSTPK